MTRNQQQASDTKQPAASTSNQQQASNTKQPAASTSNQRRNHGTYLSNVDAQYP
jgi:hypothetical protein